MKVNKNFATLIDASLIDSLKEKAKSLPRKRTNFNFHETLEENPHRFLNVMLKSSYFTPHRHLNPPKHESFLVLEGSIAFFVFAENGDVQNIHILGEKGLWGIDILPGVWHTIAVLSEIAVCYEVKPGPYVVTSDKEFAPWAPHEGSPECDAYLMNLLNTVSHRK